VKKHLLHFLNVKQNATLMVMTYLEKLIYFLFICSKIGSICLGFLPRKAEIQINLNIFSAQTTAYTNGNKVDFWRGTNEWCPFVTNGLYLCYKLVIIPLCGVGKSHCTPRILVLTETAGGGEEECRHQGSTKFSSP
jgi:hypothetical protein